jgi:uncharacterized protein with HEPN domain
MQIHIKNIDISFIEKVKKKLEYYNGKNPGVSTILTHLPLSLSEGITYLLYNIYNYDPANTILNNTLLKDINVLLGAILKDQSHDFNDDGSRCQGGVNVDFINYNLENITTDFKNEFSDVEWFALKGLRNVLAHEYFGVDYQLVWNLIVDRVPELKIKINNILIEKFSE